MGGCNAREHDLRAKITSQQALIQTLLDDKRRLPAEVERLKAASAPAGIDWDSFYNAQVQP